MTFERLSILSPSWTSSNSEKTSYKFSMVARKLYKRRRERITISSVGYNNITINISSKSSIFTPSTDKYLVVSYYSILLMLIKMIYYSRYPTQPLCWDRDKLEGVNSSLNSIVVRVLIYNILIHSGNKKYK